jgi:hypothetical protein
MHVTILITLIIVCILYLTPFFLTKHIKNPNNNRFKTIFRTGKHLELNNYQYNYCHQKWKDLNPEYNIVWFNDCMMNKFMEGFSDRINTAYKTLKPGAYKADLWRLCILYKYGGVYVDSYSTPYVGLDTILQRSLVDKNSYFISVLDNSLAGSGIHNGFIMCRREHPILLQAILDIVENVENRYYGDNPLSVTGPLALKKSIEKVTGTIPKEGYNRVKKDKSCSYYLLRHHFGPYQNVTMRGELILRKYYSFLIYILRICSKNRYTRMWYNKDIYN